MSRGGAGGAKRWVRGKARYVWVLEAGTPVAVQVKTGLSDGRMTEVESEKLQGRRANHYRPAQSEPCDERCRPTSQWHLCP